MWLIALVLVVGCKNENDQEPEVIPPAKVDHTVIIYMAANTNLSPYATNNINAMERAFRTEYGARVLIFYNQNYYYNDIIEVVQDNTNAIASTVLKRYPSGTNPCDAQTLTSVIEDCRELAPADKYSLILWAHGTGWLPQDMAPAKTFTGDWTEENSTESSAENNTVTYTFGNVYSTTDQMEIYDLVDALPSDLVFEYIFFDACHMGCVEIAHQMRHNTKYLVSSVAEILGNGYDYEGGFRYIVEPDPVGIGNAFFNYYNNQSGVNKSATISVVDLGEMDNLATEFKKLVDTGGIPTATQQFGRYFTSTISYKNLFWDLQDLALKTWGETVTQDFTTALNSAVVYKGATEYMFYGDYYGTVKINTHSGLSAYIPLLSQPQTLGIYTQNYSWAQDTEFYRLAY